MRLYYLGLRVLILKRRCQIEDSVECLGFNPTVIFRLDAGRELALSRFSKDSDKKNLWS